MLNINKKIVQNKATMLVGDSNRYYNEKGEVSLIYPCHASFGMFEIYCIKGDLFEDIERYDTLEEAEERINSLLN